MNTTQELPAWVHNAAMRQARHTGPVRCPDPECGREFLNEWAGRTHYRMAHMRKPKKKLTRGPYKKRNSMVKSKNEPVIGHKHNDSTAKYCPECGTNMAAVNLALKIAGEQ